MSPVDTVILNAHRVLDSREYPPDEAWTDLLAVAEDLLARVAAVEALHFAHGRNILGKPVCAECSPLQPMPCPTLRASAASPTPTTGEQA